MLLCGKLGDAVFRHVYIKSLIGYKLISAYLQGLGIVVISVLLRLDIIDVLSLCIAFIKSHLRAVVQVDIGFGRTVAEVGEIALLALEFKTEARWYSQIIKLFVGLGIVLLLKSALSSPLVSLFGDEFIARGVRYFLVVCFAGLLWPLTFKYFARLRISFLDNLFARKTDK